ncbi:PD-(D/E)XK nuclease family protein [uncultured Serinicoccus sp.]|uniref:PD-(D/E)XK nuclease family protein n=1 Tax=uncultured Serinicoccus sp. TaxID=735514 RepID=UPI00261FF3D5|nr:PD-(D/E)XK nuclease family protein [uncultured Serinicoccus sp.]
MDAGFNVFDVMHHGLHEKQISNVFRWLLEEEGSHNLGDLFVRLFIDELNTLLVDQEPLLHGGYWVRQEVNTAVGADAEDIADLVLESKEAVVVVENYFTSDGHGHDHSRYQQYSRRDSRRGVVVLLCRDENRSLQTLGWENAPVLTYAKLIGRLRELTGRDLVYQRKNPEAYSFVEQMYRKFVEERGRMVDEDVLGFVVAMCETGEARRYQQKQVEVAAEQFASDLAEQARRRFDEGRLLLQQIKSRLKGFGAQALRPQLNATFGNDFVRKVSATYAGIYQWTVNFDIDDVGEDIGEARLQLKFGPSAWFANESDPAWRQRVDPAVADYSRLFLTRAANREVRQSIVTLQEVVDGLDKTDTRLHDEIVQLLAYRP